MEKLKSQKRHFHVTARYLEEVKHSLCKVNFSDKNFKKQKRNQIYSRKGFLSQN